jgi:hypothetical protein
MIFPTVTETTPPLEPVTPDPFIDWLGRPIKTSDRRMPGADRAARMAPVASGHVSSHPGPGRL